MCDTTAGQIPLEGVENVVFKGLMIGKMIPNLSKSGQRLGRVSRELRERVPSDPLRLVEGELGEDLGLSGRVLSGDDQDLVSKLLQGLLPLHHLQRDPVEHPVAKVREVNTFMSMAKFKGKTNAA